MEGDHLEAAATPHLDQATGQAINHTISQTNSIVHGHLTLVTQNLTNLTVHRKPPHTKTQ